MVVTIRVSFIYIFYYLNMIEEVLKKLGDLGVPSDLLDKIKGSIAPSSDEPMDKKEECCDKCGAPIKDGKAVEVAVEVKKTKPSMADLMKKFM